MATIDELERLFRVRVHEIGAWFEDLGDEINRTAAELSPTELRCAAERVRAYVGFAQQLEELASAIRGRG
jgi:hypothetical protein